MARDVAANAAVLFWLRFHNPVINKTNEKRHAVFCRYVRFVDACVCIFPITE